jgi:hypothetical protein
VVLWADLVAALVIVEPVLSVCVAAEVDAVDSGTAMPNVRTVCDVDSESDVLELELSASAVL